MKNKNILVFGLVLLCWACPLAESACNYLCYSCSNCISVINTAPAYSTICLNNSIFNFSGTCINNPANFNNKIFDCQDKIIDGDDSGTDYGFYLNKKTGNTIKNCVVNDFTWGFYIYNSTKNTIYGSEVDNSEIGFNVQSSSQNTLSNNLFTCDRTKKYYCDGFSISGSRNTINFNTAYHVWSGFLIGGSNNTVYGNGANYNDYGIYFQGAENNNISFNVVRYNWFGFVFDASTNNRITHCTSEYNTYGVWYFDYSYNNWFEYNTFCDNTDFDFGDWVCYPISCNATGYENTCSNIFYDFHDIGYTGCTHSCCTPNRQNGSWIYINSSECFINGSRLDNFYRIETDINNCTGSIDINYTMSNYSLCDYVFRCSEINFTANITETKNFTVNETRCSRCAFANAEMINASYSNTTCNFTLFFYNGSHVSCGFVPDEVPKETIFLLCSMGAAAIYAYYLRLKRKRR